MIPKKGYWALAACAMIARHATASKPVTIVNLERLYNLPQRKLEAVVQTLARTNTICSQPGLHGGYYIPDTKTITLDRILGPFIIAVDLESMPFKHTLTTLQAKTHSAFMKELHKTTLAQFIETIQTYDGFYTNIAPDILDYVI